MSVLREGDEAGAGSFDTVSVRRDKGSVPVGPFGRASASGVVAASCVGDALGSVDIDTQSLSV